MRLQRACVALHFILRRMGAKPGQAAAPYGVPLRYGELDRVKLQIAVIAGINYEFSFLALFSMVGSILCWRCLDKDQEKLGIGEVKQRTIQNMTLC